MKFFETRIAKAVYGLFKSEYSASQTDLGKFYPEIERLNLLVENVNLHSETDPSQGIVLTMCDGSKYLVTVLPLKG